MKNKLFLSLSLLTAIGASAQVQNDNCSGATSLNVGSDFTSGATISTNVGATTDGVLPSCADEQPTGTGENVWFSVFVPASGKLTIETRSVNGSAFDNTSVLSVYSGVCGSLTEVSCDSDGVGDNAPKITLTGQTPGAKLYVSVWKYYSGNDQGQFQISAYDDSTVLHTSEVDKSKEAITISPNPVSDLLTISDVSQVQSMSVTDTSGRLIKRFKKVSAPIDLGNLKEGIYFISLKMKNGSTKVLKAIKK